ncbi:metal ABC transporter solute-binding protein, Zn/Mn family [Leucobacter sp. HY1910]
MLNFNSTARTAGARAAARATTRSAQILAGVTALAAAFALTACAGGSLDAAGAAGGTSDSSGSGGKLRVVTTTTQLTDFANEIGARDIVLHGLMQPGSSAHHFDPSPADLLALAQADVLVTNGLGLEPFLDSAIEASGFQGEIVTASDGIDLDEAAHVSEEMAAAGGEHAEHSDEDTAEHTDEDTAEHTAEHTDDQAASAHEDQDAHDGHDHGPINPHIWTSVRNSQGMVAEIAAGLEAADPAHALSYEDRAAHYVDELTALDEWAATQFKRVPEAKRVLVTGHDSLSYYLHDYDIAFAGAILPSFEDNAEPSATEIDALVARIKAQGVPAIFVESSMSPKLARTIAREAGVRVIDAESLYADALGAQGSGASTYLHATAHNTRVLLEAWGFDPDPLPTELAPQAAKAPRAEGAETPGAAPGAQQTAEPERAPYGARA